MIKNILIVLILVLLGGGAYLYYGDKDKEIIVPKELKEYADPSGVFSLTYDDSIQFEKSLNNEVRFFDKKVVAEKNDMEDGGLVNPLRKDVYDNVLSIGVISNALAVTGLESQLSLLEKSPGVSASKENVVIGGQAGYKVVYTQSSSRSIVYYVVLSSKVLFTASIVSTGGSQEWIDKAESIVNSTKFDLTKIESVVDLSENRASDSQVKALMSNIRASAEIYIDTHKDYTGICKSAGSVFLKVLNEIEEKVGSNISCFDGKAYSVSVRLVGGGFYCVDSSGYLGKASKLSLNNVCVR